MHYTTHIYIYSCWNSYATSVAGIDNCIHCILYSTSHLCNINIAIAIYYISAAYPNKSYLRPRSCSDKGQYMTTMSRAK